MIIEPKVSMLIKILLNRFHPGAGDSLLKNLPKEEAQAIAQQNTSVTDVTPLLTFSQDLIARTHYSWIAPSLQKLPTWKQRAIVAALPKPLSMGLKDFLKLPNSPSKPSPPVKAFFLGQFFEAWQPEQDILPIQFLPTSPLSPLLQMSKNQLVEIIDLLAMYDLAESIRHIVDRKQLKAIYSCLSPPRQQFLRLCLHMKEKVTSPKLEIDKWDGSPEKLARTLHKRGLLRLGNALCGQHPDFFWYVTHTLDTGRGEALARCYKETAVPDVTSFLVQQVLSLINFTKQKDQS